MINIGKFLLARPSKITIVKRSNQKKIIRKGLFKKDEVQTVYSLTVRVDDNTQYGYHQQLDYIKEEDRDKEFEQLEERLRDER